MRRGQDVAARRCLRNRSVSETDPMQGLHGRDYALSEMWLQDSYQLQMNVRAHVQNVCVLHIQLMKSGMH
jgi:hypothetical protein